MQRSRRIHNTLTSYQSFVSVSKGVVQSLIVVVRTGFSLAKAAGHLDSNLLEQATRLLDRPVRPCQNGKGHDGKGWNGGKASAKGKGSLIYTYYIYLYIYIYIYIYIYSIQSRSLS